MSQFLQNRARVENDITLAQEMIIGSFFAGIRDNIGEDVLTRDEEILLVLECMTSTMLGTEEEHAETLGTYLGIKV